MYFAIFFQTWHEGYLNIVEESKLKKKQFKKSKTEFAIDIEEPKERRGQGGGPSTQREKD